VNRWPTDLIELGIMEYILSAIVGNTSPQHTANPVANMEKFDRFGLTPHESAGQEFATVFK